MGAVRAFDSIWNRVAHTAAHDGSSCNVRNHYVQVVRWFDVASTESLRPGGSKPMKQQRVDDVVRPIMRGCQPRHESSNLSPRTPLPRPSRAMQPPSHGFRRCQWLTKGVMQSSSVAVGHPQARRPEPPLCVSPLSGTVSRRELESYAYGRPLSGGTTLASATVLVTYRARRRNSHNTGT